MSRLRLNIYNEAVLPFSRRISPGKSRLSPSPWKLYYNVAVYLCTIKTYNGTFPSVVAWPPCKNCQNFVPRHYEITCPLSSKSVPRSPRRINLDRCADVIKNFIAYSADRVRLVTCQILWIEFVNHTSCKQGDTEREVGRKRVPGIILIEIFILRLTKRSMESRERYLSRSGRWAWVDGVS